MIHSAEQPPSKRKVRRSSRRGDASFTLRNALFGRSLCSPWEQGWVQTCANCHQRHPSVRLYRIPFIGLRPLCEPCRQSLDAMGYSTAAAA